MRYLLSIYFGISLGFSHLSVPGFLSSSWTRYSCELLLLLCFAIRNRGGKGARFVWVSLSCLPVIGRLAIFQPILPPLDVPFSFSPILLAYRLQLQANHLDPRLLVCGLIGWRVICKVSAYQHRLRLMSAKR